MQIRTSEMEIRVDGRPMRTVVVSPKADGPFPGILLYSEIFQLTGPIRRSIERLAGHGFVVVGPEIYHRIEPPGLVIPYDDAGRMRGQDDAARTAVAEFDSDRIAVIDFLEKQPNVIPGRFGAMGFCIGGHLAFRAALDTRIGAAVCCYPTGLHTGKVGKEPDAGTLTRAKEIKGELLVVFGAADPHIPEEGRRRVADALAAARVKNRIHLAPGEHAFMRDEGNRYDPEASDEVWGMTVELFRRVLSPK